MLDGETIESLQYVGMGLATLSTLASVWLIIILKNLNSVQYSIKMIKQITYYVLIQSISAILLMIVRQQNLEKYTLKVLSISAMSSCAALYWSTALAYFSYKTIKSQKGWNYHRFYRISLFGILPFSFAQLLLYFLIHRYIAPDNDEFQTWALLIIFTPFFLASLLITTYCYLKQKSIIEGSFTQEHLKIMNIKLSKLIIYPTVQFLMHVPLFIGGALNESSTAYQVIGAIFATNGVINTIVYVYIRNINIQNQNFLEIEEFETQRQSIQAFCVQELSKDLDQSRDDSFLEQALRD